MKILNSFYWKLITEYKKNSYLLKIFKYLNSNQLNFNKIRKSLKERSKIIFVIYNNLLYYKDIEANYLIILINIRNEVFKLTHNRNNYVNLY